MAEMYVGIDAAAESFTASWLVRPGKAQSAPSPFENNHQGVHALRRWLDEQEIDSGSAIFCIENTGVYSEALCYQLHEEGLRVALLDPRTLRKAFGDGQPKSDAIDSFRLAEFGFRYADKLRIWQPQEDIVEQIQVLLRTREQLVQQKTAIQNSRSTLARKVIQTPAANRALDQTLGHLKTQIKALEEALKNLIKSHPSLMQGVSLLMTAPGVRWLLAAHLLVVTRGFTEIPQYRSFAQYLGIAPNEFTSGTSVRKRSMSRRYGPKTLRKLLHLAARSLRTHEPEFRTYFLRKTTAGKPKTLVLNNIANKLLKRLCAMMRSRSPYIRNHQSLDPRLLTLA